MATQPTFKVNVTNGKASDLWIDATTIAASGFLVSQLVRYVPAHSSSQVAELSNTMSSTATAIAHVSFQLPNTLPGGKVDTSDLRWLFALELMGKMNPTPALMLWIRPRLLQLPKSPADSRWEQAFWRQTTVAGTTYTLSATIPGDVNLDIS